MSADPIAQAHGITDIPDRCHDCSQPSPDLYLVTEWDPATHTGSQHYLCGCCCQHPDHQADNPDCPTCPQAA